LEALDTAEVIFVEVVALIAAAWLIFGPMFDAPRRGESAWPWIVGGLLVGPLSGFFYYSRRHSLRAVARRNA
jgi:hypothetical protein